MAQGYPNISTLFAVSFAALSRNGTNEGESSCTGHVQGRYRRGIGQWVRGKEVSSFQVARYARQCCNSRSEEDWCFHRSRLGSVEDSHKASHESREKEVFGKVVMVKAKPARKIVKAFP